MIRSSTGPLALAFVAIVVANVLGGISYGWQKEAVEYGLPPSVVVGIRNLVATVVLFLILITTRGLRLDFTRGDWVKLLFVGTFGYGLPLVLGNIAVTMVPSANGAIFILLEPVAIIAFSILFLKERVRALQITGLGIALVGAAIIAMRGFDPELLSEFGQSFRTELVGNGILILHAILWGTYTPTIRTIAAKHRATDMTFVIMTAGFLVIGPFAAYDVVETGWTPSDATNLTAGITYAVVLGLLVSLFATVLWNASLRVLEATRVAGFVLLQPIVGGIYGVTFLGEPLYGSTIVGGCAIGIGVAAVILPGTRRPPVAKTNESSSEGVET